MALVEGTRDRERPNLSLAGSSGQQAVNIHGRAASTEVTPMRSETAGDPETDEALIERWRRGDDRAATTLVERHAAGLGRFAASLGEWEQVDELVQDTLVKAFASIDGFRGESSFRTWLFTIMRRLMLDARRRERRRRDILPLEVVEHGSEFGALDRLVAEETQVRMIMVLDKLTSLQREVFSLRVSEGMAYRDIAAVLGTTEGAARVHYHNALRQVKEVLND